MNVCTDVTYMYSVYTCDIHIMYSVYTCDVHVHVHGFGDDVSKIIANTQKNNATSSYS